LALPGLEAIGGDRAVLISDLDQRVPMLEILYIPNYFSYWFLAVVSRMLADTAPSDGFGRDTGE
jgi:hypothetical protein